MQIKVFTSKNQVLHRQALQIRTQVFVEEQHVPSDLEVEHEDECTHYLAFLDDKAIATARSRETDKGVKLERFAVLKEYRNQNIGAELLHFVIKKVIPLKKYIYLNAQINALRFYEKNGFQVIGPQFEDAGIQHFQMEYVVM